LKRALSTMILGSVLVPVMLPKFRELILVSGFEKFARLVELIASARMLAS
jgi:hypothetical protein